MPRRLIPVGLVLAAFALLLGAWWHTTAPGRGPDESQHFVRALGAGGGELRGSPLRWDATTREFFSRQIVGQPLDGPSRTGRIKARFLLDSTRHFDVPAGLRDIRFPCRRPGADRALCERPLAPFPAASYTAGYQPWVLIVPGAAMRLGDTPESALRIGRGVLALGALLLLAGALLAAWRPEAGLLSLAGLLVAVTPVALDTATFVSGSGFEIAGAVCFAAGLLRLSRPDPERWSWAAAGAGGAALACARPAGVLYVVLVLAAVVAVRGAGGLRAAAAGARRPALAAGGAVLVGMLLGGVWQVAFQVSPAAGAARISGSAILGDLPGHLRDALANFGQFPRAETPPLVWVPLLALVLVLLGAALAAGTRRERIALAGVVATVLVVSLGLDVVQRRVGFEAQGRHVLALAALVPLLCADVVVRRRAALPAGLLHGLAVGTPVVVAGAHAVAWWVDARIESGAARAGASVLALDGSWDPPGGWAPSIVLVLAAVAALAAAAWLEHAARRSRGYDRDRAGLSASPSLSGAP